MKRYADCSDDIKKTARMIVDSHGSDGALLEGAIAAALDSEREACARVCETGAGWITKYHRGAGFTEVIAASIRNRGKP